MISVTVEYRRTDGRLRVHASTDAGYNPDAMDDIGHRVAVQLLAALDQTKGEWAEQVEVEVDDE